MAQQIKIDIVAETNKLTAGVNDAKQQITGLNDNLKGVVSAAGAAASAFLLKEGVTFLKQGIDEARDAKIAMNNAESAFGEGSVTLQKITEDAEKFGKALAVDNDDIIKLATSLGSRLPEDAKILSAALVDVAFDVEAYTGGALSAEAVTGKLAKAFADGEISAKELRKIVPDLADAVYDQAEAASKAGDNQKALDIIIEAAQKKYGDAAEKNVTSTQKFDTALADLKEQVGTQVLPIVEKFVSGLTTLLEWFDKQPDAIKKIEIALGILLTVGALTLTFLASMKTSLVTLGIVNGTTAGSIGLVTVATNLLKIALAGLGIGLVIAAIVLLIQHWDDVKEAVGKFWEMIKDVIPKAWAKIQELKDKAGEFIGKLIDKFAEIPGEMVNIGKNIVQGLWNGMTNLSTWFRNKIVGFFGDLLPSWAKKALGISSPSKVFAKIGTNITDGLWKGLKTKESSLKNSVNYYFGDLLPSWAKDALQIASPSKVFAQIGSNIIDGLAQGMFGPQSLLNTPVINAGAANTGSINVTINAGVGTDPYALGRTVQQALTKYGKITV